MKTRWQAKLVLVAVLVMAQLRWVPMVQAAVTPTGVVGFGETAADDNMQFLNYTSPSTYTDRGNSVDVTTETNDIQHVRLETAPTRDEIMAGQLKNAGLFNVTRCIGQCDASADWSEQLEIAGVSATQTCDGTSGGCYRPFDIAYEQLGGRAIVAYGKAANDGIVYYNIWNGTSWSGESSFTFKVSSAVDTLWIRLVPEGELLNGRRSNRIMLLVTDNANDVFASVWDGSTWSSVTTISATTASPTREIANFAWESSSGNGLVVWAEGTTAVTTPFNHKKYVNGTWDASNQGSVATYAATGIGAWVIMASHSTSDRIAVALENTSTDGILAIWKADGSTAGFTSGVEDATLETNLVPNVWATWEKSNSGTPLGFFTYADAGNADVSDYITWTQGGGFSAQTDISGAMADDAALLKLYPALNTDEILMLGVEFSDDLCFQRWSGTAWDADCTVTEYSTTLPPDTATAHNELDSLDFTYRAYSPWQRNWRFFDDETVNDPSTGLNGAAENTTPTNVDNGEIIRLRVNVVEQGGLSQTDTRKKLQFTSGCDPNTDPTACTWFELGNLGDPLEAWNYATAGESCSNCADGSTSTTTRLTGSDQSGPAVVYVGSSTAAPDADFDHTAFKVLEYDFPLKAQNVAAGTTYYFRMYEPEISGNGQNSPVYPEQDNDGNNDCASSTCTYPSVTTTAANTTFTQSSYRWYVDSNAENVTDPWGNPNLAEDSAISILPAFNTPPVSAEELRLRLALTVGTADLAASAAQFKLQYKAGTDQSCTTGSWTDVGAGGSGSIWRYATSSVTDGTTLTALKLTVSDVLQKYAKSAPTTTNPNSATIGQDIEYDFHLEHNGAVAATTYSFRAVKSDGSVLSSYTVCPTLTTSPVTSNLLRHGDVFADELEKGFFWAN
jgi:hypothetical protein